MAIGWLWGSSQADGKSSVLKNEAGGESGAVQSSGCPVKMGSVSQVVGKGDQAQSTGGACPVPEDRRADHPMMIMLDPRNNMRAGGESQCVALFSCVSPCTNKQA